MSASLDDFSDPHLLDGLTGWPLDRVRAFRDEAQAAEGGLSYVRRVVQGRLDIVGAELQRRREGGDPGDLSGLIAQLPDLLADPDRPPGAGARSPRRLDLAEVPDDLAVELDQIVDTDALADLPGFDTEALDKMAPAAGRLRALDLRAPPRRAGRRGHAPGRDRPAVPRRRGHRRRAPGLTVPSGDELKGEIETRWRDLGEFIREQRNLGQLSLRKLSEKAGVSNPYLSQIERGLRKPSAEILRQIARALEISSESSTCGPASSRSGTTARTWSPRSAGSRDLTEDQKKTPHPHLRVASAARTPERSRPRQPSRESGTCP